VSNKYSFLEKDLSYRDLDLLRKNKADWLANSDYAENTKKSYWIHFNSIRPFETKKSKDLCWFTKDEIEEVMNSKEAKRLKVRQSLYSVIKKYMVYSFDRGIISYNPCDDIDSASLLGEPKVNYVRLDEFYNFIDSLEMSDIDKLLLTLFRYGVEVDNIGSIKWSDLNESKKELKVNSLVLPVDERFVERVHKAKVCKHYHDKVTFIDKGYMIKTSKNCTWDKIPKEQVNNKINNICIFNNIDRISSNDLKTSRKFDLLFNLLALFREVNTDDYRRVISVFDKDVTDNKVSRLKTLFEHISGVKSKRVSKGKRSRNSKE